MGKQTKSNKILKEIEKKQHPKTASLVPALATTAILLLVLRQVTMVLPRPKHLTGRAQVAQ